MRQLLNTIGEFRWLIILNLFLISPLIIFNIKIASEAADWIEPMAVWNLATSVLWLVTLHLLIQNPVRLHLLLLPFYLTSIADLFLVFTFQSRLSTSYLSVAIENLEDTDEFFQSYLPNALPLGIAFALLYLLGLRKLSALRITVPKKWGIGALALLCALYGAVTARQMRTVRIGFVRAIDDVIAHDFSSPFGVVSQGYVFYTMVRTNEALLKNRDDFSFEVSKSPLDQDEIYIVVLGESCRPDHWGVNGYERDTSPHLSKEPNLVAFPDVTTGCPSTSLAVPLILSLTTVDELARVYSEKSIISAFNQAEFKTCWFATPEVSPWAGMIHVIGNEAKTQRYYDRVLDTALLEITQQTLAAERVDEKKTKTLLILHTRGSHTKYTNRYPSEFEIFPEEGVSRKEFLDNTYDNSILFTDHLLHKLIEMLKKETGVRALLYISDHGENLLDDDNQFWGHAVGNEYDLPTAMFFWYSQETAELFPNKIESVKRNAKRRLSTANISHSLLDLAGIDANGLRKELSIFSADLADHPRLFEARGKQGDYDKLFSSDKQTTRK